MIPVTQTKTVVRNKVGEEVQRGNCYAAAIASILELPITEVPNVETLFHLGSSYAYQVMHAFLESIGWELMTDDRYKLFHTDIFETPFDAEMLIYQYELKGRLYLVTGKSARGVYHICIYRDGKLVWDPHPSRDGLETLEIFETLEKKQQ